MFDYGETVTRLRAVEVTDEFSVSGKREDWTTPNERSIPGCGIVPVSSSEAPTTDRAELLTLRTLTAPHGSDILHTDRIRTADGLVWTIDGHPSDPTHPMTGWQPGMVVALRLKEG